MDARRRKPHKGITIGGKDMAKNVTIAIVQADTEIGNKEANVEKGVAKVEEAAKAGAEIVALPELFLTGYNQLILRDRQYSLAEPVDGLSMRVFAEAARENDVYVIVGFPENKGVPGVIYNSAAFFGPGGELIGCHAKTHLFSTEQRWFRAGNDHRVYSTDVGNIGVIICFDMGFPEVGRVLALNGAEIVFVPSAWMLEDLDLWTHNLSGQATANLLYMVGANRVGWEGDLHLFGGSKIVAPRGHTVAEAPHDEEAILVQTIDLDKIVEARSVVRHIDARRPELYAEICRSCYDRTTTSGGNAVYSEQGTTLQSFGHRS
jgi:predicted amidohydrolase